MRRCHMAHLNRARHVHVPGHVRVSQVCVWLLAGFTFTLELCCVQNQAPVCSGCSKLKDKGSPGRSERGGREGCADGARSVDGARRQPHLRHTHSFTTSHHRPGRQAGHWPQRRRPPRWVGGWGRSAVSHLATKADQWFAICPRRQNMIGRVRCIPASSARVRNHLRPKGAEVGSIQSTYGRRTTTSTTMETCSMHFRRFTAIGVPSALVAVLGVL